ncbi:MAG: site-2 protease family protein [bacterium]|nr:site-2 protease family protein [bacterium]
MNPTPDELSGILYDCINIQEISIEDDVTIIRGTIIGDKTFALDTISKRLTPYNLLPLFSQKDDFQTIIKLIPAPVIKMEKRWINLLLLILTFLSTIGAGILLTIGFFKTLGQTYQTTQLIIYGVLFACSMLIILGTHELGHYFACKRRGISATLPYFIPAPFSLFGTLGAIIKIKSPIQDRNGLIEVGAAGPIAGFILTIPIAIIGLKLSKITLIGLGNQTFMGNSLLFSILTKLFAPTIPFGYDVVLHPIAFAGWVGGFITALNLLPVGQLDGGHIIYALIGEKNKFVAWAIIGIISVLGFYWQGWFFWVLFVLLVIKLRHPAPLNNISQLDTKHKIVGIVALAIFVLTFVPVPFKMQ